MVVASLSSCIQLIYISQQAGLLQKKTDECNERPPEKGTKVKHGDLLMRRVYTTEPGQHCYKQSEIKLETNFFTKVKSDISESSSPP